MKRPEFELIEWIRSQVIDRDSIVLGIGDDAAILSPSHDRESLVAVDMLMEGVHFQFPSATPQLVGRKALAVNLSDIAAMGGKPTSAFVSVALPMNRGMEFAKGIHQGLLDLADEYEVVVAGGDTNSWQGPLVISVTVMGTPLSSHPIRRSGAKPGDWLFVTGALGGSLSSGRHLTFPPRLAEVHQLIDRVNLHAMIDISDGLAADLHHILKASNAGALVDASRIPLTDTVRHLGDSEKALQKGLSDGEDFELLFAVAPDDGCRLLSEWNSETPITHIGEITVEPGCRIRNLNGEIVELAPLGWTHSLQ